MNFGGGPFGQRNLVTEFTSTLGELNLSPDFNLSREQKQKIQAARDDFKAQQIKWRTDHADDLRKLQEQMMAMFARGGGGGPAGPEQFQKLNNARQELMATSPDSAAAAERMVALLTDQQRGQFESVAR